MTITTDVDLRKIIREPVFTPDKRDVNSVDACRAGGNTEGPRKVIVRFFG